MSTKYDEIYHKLLQRIESEEFMPGDVIPKEYDLMDEYQCSRDTIRKSLEKLSQDGLIQKTKRKGSVVLDRKRYEFPVSGVVSFKELSKTMGSSVETRVICCECIKPDEKMKQNMKLNDKDRVWMIERVRNIDGEHIILDLDFLNASIVPHMSVEIAKDSLYAYIEGELGLKIAYANKEITCQSITENDKNLLDMKAYDMVVNVDSFTYLSDTRVLQFTRSRHRPDKFRFHDFARR